MNYREIQTVAKANEVVKMIEALGLNGEFTKKQFDKACEKGSTSLDWLREQGMKENGRFGHKTFNRETFRPIVKLVRQEYFTITLKKPVEKRVVVTADGKEIPNISADTLRWNSTINALLEQIFPGFRIDYVQTNEVETYRNYYEIDYDVVAEMAEWCNGKTSEVADYYGRKLEKARLEVARLERIMKTF